GTTPIITVTITDAGAWTVTLAGPVDQDPLTFSVPVNVSDGQATASTSISITIEDDAPIAISPQPASLADHAGATVTVPLDSDSQIDNNVGADQPGTLTFVNIANGQNSGFTSGGNPILLFVTGNGTVLEGRTGSSSGPLVFTVTLNHNLAPGGLDTYTVSMIGSVDNGSGIVFTNLSGGTANNQPFKIITQSGTSLELLFTPMGGTGISSDANDVGIAPSQFIDPGQGLRIDFGDFTSGPVITNHSTVNGCKFKIEQISNGSIADVRLRAVDANLDAD